MLVNHLDLFSPVCRAMITLLGYLKEPFHFVPITGSHIPAGCIVLPAPKIFIAGCMKPDAANIPTIEAIVRASQHDCVLVQIDEPLVGPPLSIDVIGYGPGHLHYHGGLDLYEHPGGQSLLINTRQSCVPRPHGLRMTSHGLMPTGELPRLNEISDLRRNDDQLRRLIWGDPASPPLGGHAKDK